MVVADGTWAWALGHGVHCRCAVLQSVAGYIRMLYRPKEERFLRARGDLGECWWCRQWHRWRL